MFQAWHCAQPAFEGLALMFEVVPSGDVFVKGTCRRWRALKKKIDGIDQWYARRVVGTSSSTAARYTYNDANRCAAADSTPFQVDVNSLHKQADCTAPLHAPGFGYSAANVENPVKITTTAPSGHMPMSCSTWKQATGRRWITRPPAQVAIAAPNGLAKWDAQVEAGRAKRLLGSVLAYCHVNQSSVRTSLELGRPNDAV